MIVPGLFSGDSSLVLIRRWLRRIGYVPEWARTPLNIDCSDRALTSLERRVGRIADRDGGPISLIGHSRGGILGRALAARRPDLLRRVISLGSGHRDGFDVSPALRPVVGVLRTYYGLRTDRTSKRGCMTHVCSCSFGVASRAPFPSRSSWSRSSPSRTGWRTGGPARSPTRATSRSPAATSGLVASRKAYRAIALALDPSGDAEIE